MKKPVVFLLIPAAVLLFQFSHPLRDGPGDVNNDGVIDVLDVVRCVAIIMGDIEPTEYELWAGDVNGDEMMDVLDIVIIVDYIMEDNEPCPTLYSPCSDNFSTCCPDTTSHDVYWQFDTLSSPGSWGDLRDIAVLDSNNIWVTGDIRIETESGIELYNVAHWNGEDWELHQLLYTGFPPGSHEGVVHPGGMIWAFDSNDIYVMAATVFHWNGESWEELFVPWVFNGQVRNMWGAPNGDLFIVGNNGTFVHYDGEGFIPIETNTFINMKSVGGTSSENVWVCGDNYDTSVGITGLFHWNGEVWRTVSAYYIQPWDEPYADSLSGVIRGVYTDDPDSAWVVTSYGMYRISVDSQGEGELVNGWTDWGAAMKDIDGNNHHDMFIGGAFALVWHYNGSDFHLYEELSNLEGIYDITGVSVKGNTVGLTGFLLNTAQGFVIRGYRQ